MRVKPGIYFAEDPAFKGKRRELVAGDYVYAMKRIIDPKVRAYWLYLFEKRLVGLDPVLERTRKTGSFEYDRLYDAARQLPDGPARYAIYGKMNALIDAYAPWVLGTYTYANLLLQPGVRGFKLNPYKRNQWKYYVVDRR